MGLGRCDPPVMFPCSCLVHPEPRVTVSAGGPPAPVPSAGRPRPPCRAGTGPSRIRSALALLRSAETPSASEHPTSSSNRETSTFCNKTAISCNFRSVAMCLLNATTKQTRAPGHPARMQQQELKSCEPIQLPSSTFCPWPCTAQQRGSPSALNPRRARNPDTEPLGCKLAPGRTKMTRTHTQLLSHLLLLP